MFADYFQFTDLIGASPILMLSVFSVIALVVNAAVHNSGKLLFGIGTVADATINAAFTWAELAI